MEYINENIQTENPFMDILMKNLKIIIYNSIIKDEAAADEAETADSIANAETYMACMENRVSLIMFPDIPENFLREVGLPESTIRAYNNLGHIVDVIPKDSGGLDINGNIIRNGETVIRINDKWVIPLIKGTVEDYLDLPSDATNGDIYKIQLSGGFDVNGKNIKAGDLLIHINSKWEILDLNIVDTYEDLPDNVEKGSIYIILGYNNGIIHNDINGIPIQSGNSILKLNDGWHLIDPHIIESFLDLPTKANEGDLYKIINGGGLDANNKLIPSDSHVVRINNKWYVLGIHREIENYDVLFSPLVASKNGIYFVSVDKTDKEGNLIKVGDTVARLSDKTYSIKLNNNITVESFSDPSLFLNSDNLYKVNVSAGIDSNGKDISAEDILIKVNQECYIVTFYSIATYESLPEIEYAKNGDLYHISDLNINVAKVRNNWYLFNNEIKTIDIVTPEFLAEESQNTIINFSKHKWYIVNPNNKGVMTSFYDLPLLTNNQICRVGNTGGTDHTGKSIISGDLVIRIKGNWYKLSLYRTKDYDSLKSIDADDGDLYHIIETGTNAVKVGDNWYVCNNVIKNIDSLVGLISDIKDGDMFKILEDGGIDAIGTTIKANDVVIRMDDRWYVCNDYYTVFDSSSVFRRSDGNTFKVYTTGGIDENGKKIEEKDTVVCIGEKFYLCSKSIKTSVDNYRYLPSPGLMYTIKESGGINKKSKVISAGDTIVLTDEDWEPINRKVVDSFISLPTSSTTGSIYLVKDSGTTYRAQLVKKLRPWFLLNFNELNEYYRKITGKPPLEDWGIPVRDYEEYLPEGFEYSGTFIHEIGAEACKELENCGVLDIIKNDYPKATYLNYLTAGLSSYECRKASDFMILWSPEEYCDELLLRKFRNMYSERRKFFIKSVYNSSMTLESEHYHATMQIYLLIMVMVDMLAEVQTHIIKKDLLDRRCVEYIFSMYGVPYYHEIPFKFQKRICYNIHKLIKYKACTDNFTAIKEVFDSDNIDFFKYYLFKVNKKDIDGNLLWEGNKVTKSRYNNEYVQVKKEIIDIPKEEDITIDLSNMNNYIDNGNKFILLADNIPFSDYTVEEDKIRITYNSIKEYKELIAVFVYSDIGVADETTTITKYTPSQDSENIITIKFPISKYISRGNYFHVIANNRIFTKYYVEDDQILILYRDVFPLYDSIQIRFVYSASNIIKTTQTEMKIDIEKEYIIPTSINKTLPITDYITKGNKLIITADDNIITEYVTDNEHNSISIPYENIKQYNTLEINYIYSTVNIPITTVEVPVPVTQNYINIPEPCEGYIDNNWPVFIMTNDKMLNDKNYDIINSEFSLYSKESITNINELKFIFYYLNTEPYVYTIYEEDYNKTKYLRFAKVSMGYLNSIQKILDQMNWKKYDIVVHRDPWWLGKDYKEDEYELVKKAIYNAEYNYMRTKYFSICYILDMSTYSTKVCFFYSALFDDIFNESLLNIIIPSISRVHYCNIAHLFIYMISITRKFYGYDDIIEEDLGHHMAVGFNYKANLKTLKKYIISQHFDPDYFKIIWDVIIPNSDITDIKEFIKIQENNEKVYHYIKFKMIDSDDYKEYKIWKYILDYLFTWQYNLNYFKISDGTVARTYEEFLKDKDPVLYKSLQSVMNIEDYEEKINTIYNTIDDICYIIENYIGKEISKHVFTNIIGKSSILLLQYIIKIVEFFKSIKIMLRDKGEVNFIGSGKLEEFIEDNVLRFYDYFDSRCIKRQNEYININEDIYINNSINKEDSFSIKEDCVIIHKINNQKEDITNVD